MTPRWPRGDPPEVGGWGGHATITFGYQPKASGKGTDRQRPCGRRPDLRATAHAADPSIMKANSPHAFWEGRTWILTVPCNTFVYTYTFGNLCEVFFKVVRNIWRYLKFDEFLPCFWQLGCALPGMSAAENDQMLDGLSVLWQMGEEHKTGMIGFEWLLMVCAPIFFADLKGRNVAYGTL